MCRLSAVALLFILVLGFKDKEDFTYNFSLSPEKVRWLAEGLIYRNRKR